MMAEQPLLEKEPKETSNERLERMDVDEPESEHKKDHMNSAVIEKKRSPNRLIVDGANSTENER